MVLMSLNHVYKYGSDLPFSIRQNEKQTFFIVVALDLKCADDNSNGLLIS